MRTAKTLSFVLLVSSQCITGIHCVKVQGTVWECEMITGTDDFEKYTLLKCKRKR